MSDPGLSTLDPSFEPDGSVFQRLERCLSDTRPFPESFETPSNDEPPKGSESTSAGPPPEAETVLDPRRRSSAPPEPPRSTGPPAVEVVGLTKVYGEKAAVRDLNLEIGRGEFFGFLGPNGAGKSTTIRMLTSLIRPTSGRALVAGVDVVERPLEVKRYVGVLPEEVNLHERLTGFEFLTFVGRIFDMSEHDIHRRAVDLFRALALSPEDASKLIVDYSMGMKKKIALAAALIHGPRVLFLDEPFNGIDAVTSRSIRLILQNAVRSGITIFFSSHVLEVVERLCHRVAIVHEGRLVALGTVDEIRRAHSSHIDAGLDDIFVQLVSGGQAVEELDWLRHDWK